MPVLIIFKFNYFIFNKYSINIVISISFVSKIKKMKGSFTRNYTKTIDGFEMNFAENYLGQWVHLSSEILYHVTYVNIVLFLNRKQIKKGHFYLTNLLIDLLIASAPSRIINVTSEGHKRTKKNQLLIITCFSHLLLTMKHVQPTDPDARIDLNDLQGESSTTTAYHAYIKSQTANVLFTHELSKRFKGIHI